MVPRSYYPLVRICGSKSYGITNRRPQVVGVEANISPQPWAVLQIEAHSSMHVLVL